MKKRFRTANVVDVGLEAWEVPDRHPMAPAIPVDRVANVYYYTREARGENLGRCVALIPPRHAPVARRTRGARYLGRVVYDPGGVGYEEGQREYLSEEDLR